jgi:phosphoribosylformylglycinamidine synthase II
VVAEVPVKSLADDAPVYHRPSAVPAYYEANASVDPAAAISEPADLNETLKAVLAQPTVASKAWVYEQYDHIVRAGTAVKPGSDAAVVMIRGTRKALAMSTDCNGRYVYLDPQVGGAIAVAEAARNVVCSGAEPLAITDCLNFGSPEKPEVFWQFEKAVDGMSEACLALNAPVIGGNVSFYNERSGDAIYPTPTVGMVGLITDVDHITTQHFKGEGDVVILLGETYGELGGSEYQKLVTGSISGRPPKLDLKKEAALQQMVLKAIRAGLVKSAHDLSEGGLGVALAECCFGADIGAAVALDTELRSDIALFSESQSRILLSVAKENAEAVLALATELGVPAKVIGTTGGDRLVVNVNGGEAINAPLSDLKAAWKDAIPCLIG